MTAKALAILAIFVFGVLSIAFMCGIYNYTHKASSSITNGQLKRGEEENERLPGKSDHIMTHSANKPTKMGEHSH